MNDARLTPTRSRRPILRGAACACGLLYGLLALLWIATPSAAADVVYPPGSRVGLVPPPGLSASASFPGFEDRAKNVAVVVGALPAQAFGEFEHSDSAEGLKRLGVTLATRETLTLPTGQALLVIGHQNNVATWMLIAAAPDLTAMVTMRVPDAAKDTYSDEVLRGMISSLALRAEVPDAEQLRLLPFKLATLADFKIGAVVPGRGIMLTDHVGPPASHMVISIVPGEPPEPGDRDDVARQVFRSIPNLKDARINAAEPLRIGNQQGYEIMATAKDPMTGTDLTVVQWLRFGAGAYLHVVGIAPTDAWTQAYGRFRAVRDGID